MRASGASVFRSTGSRMLAAVIITGVLASYGAMLAYGQQDALTIEKDGAVKVTGAFSVGSVVSAGEFVGKGAMPRGAILMWSGELKDIPQGWVLCDGNNSTPDLRGRFIVGYASKPTPEMTQLGYNQIKNLGGTNRNTITLKDLGDHTHTIATSELQAAQSHTHRIGDHTHRYEVVKTWDTTASGAGETSRADVTAIGRGVANQSTSNVVANPAATKTLDNRPPYMVLAYIMYIGK